MQKRQRKRARFAEASKERSAARKEAKKDEDDEIERGRKARRDAAIQSKKVLNEREAYEKQKNEKKRSVAASIEFDSRYLKPWLENRFFQPFKYPNIDFYNNIEITLEKGI